MRISLLTIIFIITTLPFSTYATEGGDTAPACELPQWGNSQTINPGNLRGKVVYVDFWASWCGPCAKSFPYLDSLHKELESRGLVILGINVDEDPKAADRFLERIPVSFPIALDPQGNCPGLYDVKAMPSSYMVDKNGTVRFVHLGFKSSDKQYIRENLLKLLDES